MCDVCVDFLGLLVAYESRVNCVEPKQPKLSKHEVEIIFGYIQTWQQRQCMCCYRDIKNFDRFHLVVQSMICLAVVQLKNIEKLVNEHNRKLSASAQPPLIISTVASTTDITSSSSSLSSPSSNNNINNNNNNTNNDSANDNETNNSNNTTNFVKSNENKIADCDEKSADSNNAKSKDKHLNQNIDVVNSSKNEDHSDNDVKQSTINTKSNDENIECSAQSSDSIVGGSKPSRDADKNDECASGESNVTKTDETWTLAEFEKLLILIAKAFLLNFPLYIAYKHAVHARLDDISAQDAQNLSIYCDLHENEMPVYLLRNVSLFCNTHGFAHLSACFDAQHLPVSTAHAITAVVSNLKLWLNYRSIVTLFVPIRSKILQYMCKLADQDLRSPATKTMADFMWTAIKDPLDTQITFDTDGLALAFKYFTSTTLTMRLAGMAQINAHINLFNDICTSETVAEVEMVGQKLSDWLNDNKIINHLFGPNLHVELIKQSPIVLRFLAVENQITEEHLNLIWQAAQLKHCSKAIYDVLPPLVKNLSLPPALHMYSLLCRLDPKEHTEQSIFIASTLIKLIWSRDGSRQQIDMPNSASLLAANVGSSSENSVSMDGSNSEEEHPDDDSSDGHKSTIDIEGGSDSGPTPCKQARHKNCCEETTDDSSKIEEITDENEAENIKLDAAINRVNVNLRFVGTLEPSSSEDGIDETESYSLRKKIRKRRKIHSALAKSQLQDIEPISDGESDEAVDINDSDCSESRLQTMLDHLHGKGPFINSINDSHLIGMLSGGENDGSYSSPLSQKSGKNMADFEDDDSPCEEELAQLAATSHCLTAFATPRNLNMPDHFHGNSGNSASNKSNRNSSTTKTVSTDHNKSTMMTVNEISQPGNILLWDLLMDDKIGQLGESLAIETEKALRALLCFNTEKNIRMKFIESCLQNLAGNRSVIVSLRLLPNLLASFQQFRAIDTHQVTMWAERQHKMMQHFFNNLKYYANSSKSSQCQQILNQSGSLMYSHLTQVQVRLEFLTSIFSTMGSPEHFRLSLEQVDELWEWLANDSECADCLFAWLQGQAKGSEQHALGIDTLQHLYLKKLPELRPEGISMVGLGLFQQLCSLARIAAHYEKTSDSSLDIVGMGHLWKIALRATNTDVSLAAIQYINSYYMGQQLKLEKEFVAHCMNHLKQAAEDLNNIEIQEKALMCVQRALMLLNTHLDTFRRRYAYHLRRWALEGKGFGAHSALRNDGIGPSIRIILQPGGLPDKSVLHLHTTDLVADLKAEIAKWWETLQGGAKSSGVAAPVLGLLLSEGPLRIITQGQEITSEYDERSLSDVGFKDNQMVYVSLGGRSGRRRDVSDHPSLQPAPPKECLPNVLLLQTCYFEELFTLMQKLGDMYLPGKNGKLQPHTKAQLLSRRVWDILAMLPTNPDILGRFKSLDSINSGKLSADDSNDENNATSKSSGAQEQIQSLLDPNNLQKFMYSLHIVESLTKTKNTGCCSGADGNTKPLQTKAKVAGQLKILSQKPKSQQDLSMASKNFSLEKGNENKDPQINCTKGEQQQPKDELMKSCNEIDKAFGEERSTDSMALSAPKQTETIRSTTSQQWTDIFIKCGGLRHLFDIFMSGVLQSEHNSENEWRTDCLASLLRILCLLGVDELKPEDTLLTVPAINENMMQLISAKPTLRRLASILSDASRPTNPHQFKTGYWGRAQVIHFAMNLLVCLVHSSAQAREYLWVEPEICEWLQRFILDDPEPAVRREACAALYRICLGNSVAYDTLMGPVLSRLISFLPIAEKMQSQTSNSHLIVEDGKDPYGPACRDYFWLLCRLVDTLTPEIVKESLEDPQTAIIDIETLCRQVSESIVNRKVIETRFGGQDDGLVGLLNLMANLIKYDPPFKFSADAEAFIIKIFDCLFDLPSSQHRQKPKCKSQSSRAGAYDLLVEMCRNAPNNFKILHGKLLKQHQPVQPDSQPPYPWDYWPRDDGRSECGYVGLTNLGATCYMASCIQHLFMMPQARESILKIEPQDGQKHAATLKELQRMFAYLMESERKSYNPRSFCRVYQMDHQPLNTGEQKDMAEFFIDLVSKLEEMTPELKQLIKRLFCGTLSNNVVSLDCGHVSRTREEFYTVRCQVAQMRDLHESLAEVTVKDTLEGDNMYTCDQCGRKVRAEKRACFKKLPEILCFNTMRYTFNMLTMQKEKVNTHFSFPLKLDMSGYVEKTLLPQQYHESKATNLSERKQKPNSEFENNTDADENTTKNANEIEEQTDTNDNRDDDDEDDEYSQYFEYHLIGVTVHTGNADGGHYYSFIKERNALHGQQQDRWFLFNDAEVKQFDPSQIEAECFGGEMTSKTYDTVTEKYLDFSFEKTNSAYMLFYERCTSQKDTKNQQGQSCSDANEQACCSTATIDSYSNFLSAANIATTTTTATKSLQSQPNDANDFTGVNTVLNNNELLTTSASIVDHSRSIDGPSSQTESNNDLAIVHNKCDIDNKSDINCNGNNNALVVVTSTDCNSKLSPTTQILTKSNSINTNLLNKELEDWIWLDNQEFLQDRNIFEHTYFNFMWQICGHIPQSLLMKTDVTCNAAQLSVSFFIETFIHAKEKPTMVLWVELLTKQFNGNQEACEWFLTYMSTDFRWLVHILIKCPNQMVRQMFQRLVIHVIQRLRQSHYNLYLKTDTDIDGKETIGDASCVTRFIKSLISIMEHGAKAHLRHLSEFFGLLYEFSRMGEEETLFLLKINVIRSVADFYLGHKTQDCIDTGSDNDDNSSDETLSIDKARPASLDKMIALVATLVERSRGPDLRLQLSPRDYNAIAGGKGFPFLYQQIKDNINPHQTRHLIHALCRWDERLANQIITMLFSSVTRHTELCGPFFKLLTLLTESSGGPSGLPCFSQLVLQRVWDAAEYCPQSALDWLAVQAPRNKIAHAWILQSAESWVEQFLMAHNNAKVRNAAAYLLVSLVPSQSFRANYRAASLKLPMHAPQRELSGDAQIILHTILNLLLRLLRPARVYTDILVHGPSKLSAYFGLMTYCMVTKTEKLMLNPFIRALWELFHPRLSEPSVPAHHNKQALLAFWYHATNDCPENAQAVANCQEITRNIAFNYILADHDDADIVAYNRAMLPAYYGLLRFCCQQSRSLTRQLAAHQNLQWAFKNITPHPTQYALAVDELFCLMNLFAAHHPDDTEAEQREIATFRRTTLSAYLSGLDARVSWGTLIAALRILVDNDDDRLFVVYNGGIALCFEALITLHSMYHEATACHVSGDLQELLAELALLVKTLRISVREQKKRPPASAVKNLPDAVRRLATLLNTHNPPQMRSLALDVLSELVRNPSLDIIGVLAPLLLSCHMQAQNSPNIIGSIGPYFPRRGGAKLQYNSMTKNHPRPPRSMGSMVQMSIPQTQIIQRGIDKEFDAGLDAFYRPYHDFLDVLLRMAVNMNALNESLVNLSCLAGIEGASMHFNLFPKFWVGIFNNKTTHKWVDLLLSNSNLIDYIYTVLRDERISLNDPIVLTFIEIYFPKVSLLHIDRLIDSICQTISSKENYEELCGDLLAIKILTQNDISIPAPILKELQICMKSIFLRFKDEFPAIEVDETTPPPAKKQRKLNSTSCDQNEESIESKSSSMENSKPDDINRSIESPTKQIQSEPTTYDVKPSTSSDIIKEIENERNKEKRISDDVDDDQMDGKNNNDEMRQPTITSASSISPSNSTASSSSSSDSATRPNTSTESEQMLEKDIERKLLRKIEYHLMDILQYFDEMEREALGISNISGASNSSSHANSQITSSNVIGATNNDELNNEKSDHHIEMLSVESNRSPKQ